MCWLTIPVALLGLAAIPTADDKTDPKAQPVRELIVKDLKLGDVKAKLDEPTKVTSLEELAKLVPDKDEAAKIAKDVDFSKNFLLVFAWKGSGKDKLDFEVTAGKPEMQVKFNFFPGTTADLRQHLHLFVVQKGIAFHPPGKV